MYYYRKYLQFNDLVFDKYDMLMESDASEMTTKTQTTEISFGNGSYAPFKRDYQFVKESSVSLTLKLAMKKIPCEYREFYRQFVIGELIKQGKLWAVQNNEIVWAYAYVSSHSEAVDELKDKLIVEVDFTLYEGVWHKADKQKTFVVPFDICNFLDCLNYQKVNPCLTNAVGDEDCCSACVGKDIHDDIETECCTCDHVEKEMALCYNTNNLQQFYKKCEDTYKIIYSCSYAHKFFTTEVNKYLGTKFCTQGDCDHIIGGSFYSETDIPTRDYQIVVHGIMHNPYIEINGVGITVNGDFDGYLIIEGSGDIIYRTENGCCTVAIDPNDIIVWSEEFGFTFKPRYNKVIIDTGECCGRTCAYISADAITI